MFMIFGLEMINSLSRPGFSTEHSAMDSSLSSSLFIWMNFNQEDLLQVQWKWLRHSQVFPEHGFSFDADLSLFLYFLVCFQESNMCHILTKALKGHFNVLLIHDEFLFQVGIQTLPVISLSAVFTSRIDKIAHLASLYLKFSTFDNKLLPNFTCLIILFITNSFTCLKIQFHNTQSLQMSLC